MTTRITKYSYYRPMESDINLPRRNRRGMTVWQIAFCIAVALTIAIMIVLWMSTRI